MFQESTEVLLQKSFTKQQNIFFVFPFLLQWNLPQMFALLMEPYAMIQASILGYCETVVLLQPHIIVVANFVLGNSGLFRRDPLATTRGTPVEKHYFNDLYFFEKRSV